MDFKLYILVPSPISGMVEVLNEFSKKLCFILNEEYYQYFLPDMTGISL